MSSDIDQIVKEFSKQNFDFGFTSENPVEAVEEQHQKDLKALEDLILPLLVNLLKTAEKPTIHWPNRKELLEEKIKEVLAITRRK